MAHPRMRGQSAPSLEDNIVELIMIAAMAANRVIGHNNTIPWQIPEEMAHFKTTTMGHALIMGRRTYESIGGPLPGRRTVVVTSDPAFRPHPDCLVATSLPQAIALCQSADKAFIIGGEQLFRTGLPLVQTLILTVIHQDFIGDAYFPDFSDQPFILVDSRNLAATVPLTILTYRRTTAIVPGSTPAA